MRTTALLLVALALATLAAPAEAGGKLRIKGKGVEESGSRFRFIITNESGGAGRVEAETAFGTVTGVVDCFETDGRLALMSGGLDVPTSGLTHFLVVAEDGKETRMPDRYIAYLGNNFFDCALDGADADLADDRQPIERGNIVVKLPPT